MIDLRHGDENARAEGVTGRCSAEHMRDHDPQAGCQDEADQTRLSVEE
ncbi:hypothetical protein [Actinokineospora globicatena]|uniref:Uncharacterized protein n=1 Tax=Actinokineospora globicatena TaxID=103729 RepID=A0A9W6QR96_9PSEU|nr:hypothetical protein [Actinokineospora globicatena]GLW93325.1 hypothetical protein Aglo03_41410 [Actinokineospora globicatena]